MVVVIVEGAESNAREELLPGRPTSLLQARVEEIGRRHEFVRPFCMLYLPNAVKRLAHE